MHDGKPQASLGPFLCVLVTLLILTTAPAQMTAQSTPGILNHFASDEVAHDLNFTNMSGGSDNTTISIKLPKRSTVLSASLNLTGKEFIGFPSRTTINDSKDWLDGVVEPDGYLVHDVSGVHLDLQYIGILGKEKNIPSGFDQLSIASGDLYNDGNPDLLSVNLVRDRVSTYHIAADGKLTSHSYTTSDEPIAVGTGEFNGDNKTDFVVGSLNGKALDIYLHRSTSALFSRTTISVGREVKDLYVADLTEDGRDDIILAVGDRDGMIFRQHANGTFTKIFDDSVDTGGNGSLTYRVKGCVAGDMDGDGRNDAVWTLSATDLTGYRADRGLVKVLYQDASGNFSTGNSTVKHVYTAARGVAAGDVNGDGRDDLVVTNDHASNTNVHVILQNTNGGLNATLAMPVNVTNQSWPAIGDFDGDGRNDVAICGADTNLTVMLQRDGVINATLWRSKTRYAVRDTVAADVNGDGLTDLCTANSNMGSLGRYHQTHNVSATWSSEPFVHPLPVSNVTFDLDIEDGGADTRVHISFDNSNWTEAPNGSVVNGTGGSDTFWIRLTTISPSLGRQDVVRSIGMNVTLSSFPSDVRLDVGNNGSVEWRASGEFNDTVKVEGLENGLTAYIRDHLPDIEGMVAVPFFISCATPGYIEVSDLVVSYNNVSAEPELFTPLDGGYAKTTPTFTFSANDSNGDDMVYVLQITPFHADFDHLSTLTFDMRASLYDDVPGEGFPSASFPQASVASFTLPKANALDPGSMYKWRVFAHDGYMISLSSGVASFTVDDTPPVCTVGSPRYPGVLEFAVNWSATDPAPGAGLAVEDTFDVQYMRSNETSWTAWLTGTNVTAANFTGEDGVTYLFRARARDAVMNLGSFFTGTTPTTVDVTPPSFWEDASPATADTDLSYTFAITVEDNIGVADVWVEYWYGDGPRKNESMDGTTVPVWEHWMVVEATLEDLHYVIWSNDTTGNVNSTLERTVDVIDINGPGIINEGTKSTAYTGDPFEFTLTAGDNVGLRRATLWYAFGDGELAPMAMEVVSAWPSGNVLYSIVIDVPPDLSGNITYSYEVEDLYGNVLRTHVDIVRVMDDDAPIVVEDLSDTTATTGDVFHARIRVRDNIGIDLVSARKDLWTGTDIDERGNGVYEQDFRMDDGYVGPFYLSVRLLDLAGNEFMYQIVTPDVVDNDPPELRNDHTWSDTLKGGSKGFNLVVWENVADQSVSVNVEYRLDKGPVINASMYRMHVGNEIRCSLYVDVPRDAEVLTFRYTAGDVAGNWNSSTERQLTLYNAPPEVDGVPTWNVTEGTKAELDMAPHITDPNDDTFTMECSDEAVMVEGLVLRVRHDVAIPDRTVTITVSDGEDGTEANFTIHVVNVNDLPVVTDLLPASGTEYKKGMTIVFTINATDEDGDALNITWEVGGEVLGWGSPFEWSKLSKGEHIVIVVVDDGTGHVEERFTVVVKQDEGSPGPGLVAALAALLLTGLVLAWRRGGTCVTSRP